MKVSNKLIYFLLSIGLLVAVVYKMGQMPLSADEPIRALIALDIWLNHHYIAPELNGDLYLNKPPLYNYLLVLLFKLTGSTDEWVIRLPNHVAMLAFAWTVYRITRKELKLIPLAVLSGFAVVTTGNLWFYSGYLGHIDVVYSLLVFIQIYYLYRFAEDQRWWAFYLLSYALTVVGFMMKGLPSLAFQGISILTIMVIHKSWKKLFHPGHFVGLGIFLMPIASYLMLFSGQGSMMDLLSQLVFESASRTVGQKSFLESIAHLFRFPFQFLGDLAPWSLAVLFLFRKSVRQRLWTNRFCRISILLLFANLIIYWLSPDYRARYIFMLMPFFLIPLFYGAWELIVPDRKVFTWIIRGLTVAAVTAIYVWMSLSEGTSITILLIGLPLWIILEWALSRQKSSPAFHLVLALLVIRLVYTEVAIPFRTELGPYADERRLAKAHVEICADHDVYMYHSNLALTQNWYFSAARKKMLTTKRDDFDLDDLYYVPADVIKDPDNVVAFDTFVRRFGQKPFYLVQFRHYFPPMPKKHEP
ncbi:MAG: glycosyltransferase family 39 protein [Flavobacteriales bacterium]|nr:glycosyltransferase family 39 protein [Flavobacteriales bacterium]